jgi:type II secretory pathway component GspD/PulD (secretin)
VEFNRLLLWANEIELREVENLLVKLGEIPARGANSSTMRVIDIEPGEDTEELLKRLRKIWPSLGPNELLLDPPSETKEKEKRTGDAKPQEKSNLLKSTQSTDQSIPQNNPESVEIISVVLDDETEENVEPAQGDTAETRPNTQPRIVNEQGNLVNPNSRNSNVLRNNPRPTPGISPPPISIIRTPDGRLMISSQDTRALDRLEEFMTRMAPPRKDYRVFQVKYADAYFVMLNLQEYFEEDGKKDSDQDAFNRYYYGFYPSSNDSSSTPRRLSKRKPLKFIYDLDTNTILAQGGDPEQLKTVEDLIELYDRPRNTDTKMLRQSKLISLEYAKAKIVADAVKDVYRDLLSANDKALINGPQKPKTESRYSYTYTFGDGESGQKIPKYKGALSVGVDETSNTLVLSAQPYLLDEVTKMVEALDAASKPFTSSMRVVEIRNADAFQLQKSLSGVLSKKPAAGKSAIQKPGQNGLKPGQTTQTTVISP